MLQNCRVDKFEKFDFGDEDKNTEKYGQTEPPLIDLTKINDSQIPVAIFTALHDTIQVVGDSRTVRDIILPSVVHYEEINGGHLSFLISKSMDKTYFTNLKTILSDFNPIS